MDKARHTVWVKNYPKIRKKHWRWQRYIETRSEQKFTEYNRLSNQVENLTKKAKKHKERSIAKEAKHNPKSSGNMSMARPGYAKEYPTSFTMEKMGKKEAPRMIKKRLKCYRHSSLVSSQRKLSRKYLMCHLKFWCSVKSREDLIRQNKEEIPSLNVAKSPGPDRVHPRLLKELAEIISEPLEKILIWACRAARCQRNGKLEKFQPYLKRVTGDHQWITDQSASQVLSPNFWSH